MGRFFLHFCRYVLCDIYCRFIVSASPRSRRRRRRFNRCFFSRARRCSDRETFRTPVEDHGQTRNRHPQSQSSAGRTNGTTLKTSCDDVLEKSAPIMVRTDNVFQPTRLGNRRIVVPIFCVRYDRTAIVLCTVI